MARLDLLELALFSSPKLLLTLDAEVVVIGVFGIRTHCLPDTGTVTGDHSNLPRKVLHVRTLNMNGE
jgi:hypothetical protein